MMIAQLSPIRPYLAALLLAVGLPAASQAGELNPAAVKAMTPEQFKWRDPTDRADVNQTILYGDPTKPGFYVVSIRPGPAASVARITIRTTG